MRGNKTPEINHDRTFAASTLGPSPPSSLRFLEDELQILRVADDTPLLLETKDRLIDHRTWLLGQAEALCLSDLPDEISQGEAVLALTKQFFDQGWQRLFSNIAAGILNFFPLRATESLFLRADARVGRLPEKLNLPANRFDLSFFFRESLLDLGSLTQEVSLIDLEVCQPNLHRGTVGVAA